MINVSDIYMDYSKARLIVTLSSRFLGRVGDVVSIIDVVSERMVFDEIDAMYTPTIPGQFIPYDQMTTQSHELDSMVDGGTESGVDEFDYVNMYNGAGTVNYISSNGLTIELTPSTYYNIEYPVYVSGGSLIEDVGYNFEIQSKVLYPGPEERSFSELFDMTMLVDFSDDNARYNSFTVGVKSDFYRFKESADYFEQQNIMSAIPEPSRDAIRHNIQVVPQVGFYGSFFSYYMTKRVPADGNFKFLGARGTASPVHVDQEFVAGLEPVEDGWN